MKSVLGFGGGASARCSGSFNTSRFTFRVQVCNWASPESSTDPGPQCLFRRSATDHLDAGLSSSCATLVRKQLVKSKGSRGATHERAPTRLVTLHVFLVRPDIKTLSANTSPLALTDQTPQHFHKHVQTARHSQTGQHNTLHKHVRAPWHTVPDATANTDTRASMLHLSICALYLHIYTSSSVRTFCVHIYASSRLCICISALSRLCIYAPMHLRLTVNPIFSPPACEF